MKYLGKRRLLLPAIFSGGAENMLEQSSGIGKLVYGLEKVNFAVRLENGRIIRRPAFPLSDCRSCALLDVVCEEIDSPCIFLLRKCSKRQEERDCEACGELSECLNEKPCCWDCPYLTECLEMARERGGELFVKSTYGCSWEEFEAAVKMLAEDEE